MLSAFEKFQQSGHAATHKKWAESLDAEAASDYALLAFVEELPDSGNPLAAADTHARLMGARRYREIILSLHKTKPPTKGTGLFGPNLKAPG